MGLAIKKLAGEANSMGIRAIAAQLKNELPNESWYPPVPQSSGIWRAKACCTKNPHLNRH
jgi:hypothetical protein